MDGSSDSDAWLRRRAGEGEVRASRAGSFAGLRAASSDLSASLLALVLGRIDPARHRGFVLAVEELSLDDGEAAEIVRILSATAAQNEATKMRRSVEEKDVTRISKAAERNSPLDGREDMSAGEFDVEDGKLAGWAFLVASETEFKNQENVLRR